MKIYSIVNVEAVPDTMLDMFPVIHSIIHFRFINEMILCLEKEIINRPLSVNEKMSVTSSNFSRLDLLGNDIIVTPSELNGE